MTELVLHHLLRHGSETPERLAYTYLDGGRRRRVTWGEYVASVRRVGRAFLALGFEAGDRVCILGNTRPEWSIACLGAQLCGGVPAGIYQTCSPEQIAYVAHHAECKILVLEDAGQWQKVASIRDQLPHLQTIVVMVPGDTPEGEENVLSWTELGRLGDETVGDQDAGDRDAELERRLAAIQADDLATFIYTSGTTGHPKAVMLSHWNLLETGRICVQILGFTRDDELVSYLPLAHVAEQNLTIHLGARTGLAVHYVDAPEALPATLQEVQPTFFFGVPRVWERFHAVVSSKLSQASPLLRAALRWALGVGLAYRTEIDAGRLPGTFLGLKFRLADRLLGGVRKKLGFARLRIAASGAAPISREILDFFSGLGATIYEVYGLSETTGPATWNRVGHARQGTVGPALPDVEIRIADDGEVLIKGPNIFIGYSKDPEATAEVFDDEGFFHTGDLGAMDDDGFVTITGRKKEILITSGGKNIAPAPIENLLKQIDLVGDAMVLGDGRRFLSALLTLEEEAAALFVEKHGLDKALLENGELHRHPKVHEALQEAIDEVNEHLARVESLRAFRVLPRRLSQEEGELTPTLKVKRRIVMETFGDVVEEIYR